MKKCMVCALLLLIAGLLFGSDARTGALGGSMPYYLDDVQVLTNPALMPVFGNCGVLELGSYPSLSGQSAYGMVGVTENIYVGAALLRNKDNFDIIESMTPLPSDLEAPQNDIDVMIGMALGELSVGFGAHIAGWSYDWEMGDSKMDWKTNAMAFTVGGAYIYDEMLVDGNLALTMNSYKRENSNGSTTTGTESEGGMSIGMSARAHLPMNSFKIVPAFSFETFSCGYDVDDGSTVTDGPDISTMNINVLVGANIPVFDDGWIAPGLGFRYFTTKWESGSNTENTTLMVMPEVYVGGEFPVKDWIVARMGYKRFFGTYKEKTHTTEDEIETWPIYDQGYEPDMITVGVGIKLLDGAISIDGTVGENFIHQGGWLVSGIQDNLFGNVSLGVGF